MMRARRGALTLAVAVHPKKCPEASVRKLFSVLVVALLSAYLPPAMQTLAAPVGDPTAASDSTAVAAKSKKNRLKVTLDEIESVKKGRRDFEITARLSNANDDIDYWCRLTITYSDGTSQQPDDVAVDDEDICTVRVDIPNDADVVGDAEAELIVIKEGGWRKGKVVQDFEVLSGR
jgi:hypothetical protein